MPEIQPLRRDAPFDRRLLLNLTRFRNFIENDISSYSTPVANNTTFRGFMEKFHDISFCSTPVANNTITYIHMMHNVKHRLPYGCLFGTFSHPYKIWHSVPHPYWIVFHPIVSHPYYIVSQPYYIVSVHPIVSHPYCIVSHT